MEVSARIVTLWRLPMSLLMVCCILAGATLLVSRGLPAPANESVIRRSPCELPCFFSITPGATSRDQALEILARYVDYTRVSDYLVTFLMVDYEGRASIANVNFAASGALESVRVFAVDRFADVGQLGDVLLAGQQPTHVYRTCDFVLPIRFLMTFGAHDELLVELFPRGKLAPETPITLFDLSQAESRSLYDARASFGCSVETGWLGFAPAWRYLTQTLPVL